MENDTAETKTVTVGDMPTADLEALRPHAIRHGYRGSDPAVVRYAVVELARIRRAESERDQFVTERTKPARAKPR